MGEYYNQIDALLRRVGLFLEEEAWEQADAYCERILDMDPENVKAYTGKLFAKFHISNTQQFLQTAMQRLQEVMDDANTKKILRFGTEQEKAIFQNLAAAVENERFRQQDAVLTDTFAAVQLGHFDVAIHNLGIFLEQMPNDHRLWFWRMMARYQCSSLAELVEKGIPINNDPDYRKAVACADAGQAQSYRETAAQVLFSTQIKCQNQLIRKNGPRENTVHLIDLYLKNCAEDDPYGTIYAALRKIPLADWNEMVLIGFLIHMQDAYDREMAAGRLRKLDGDRFSGQICSYVQAPAVHISLGDVIAERLHKLEMVLLGDCECPLGSPGNVLREKTVKPKALSNPEPRPTPPVLVRDYVATLLYEHYRLESAGMYGQYGKGMPVVLIQQTKTLEILHDWAAPDTRFSSAAGMDALPVPAAALKRDKPQEIWQRYAYIAQRTKLDHILRHCAYRIHAMAPDYFNGQLWIRERFVNNLIQAKDMYSLKTSMSDLECLYPEDYSLHYGQLRQLTEDFKPPRSFDSEYANLAKRLQELKRRDKEERQKLQNRYQELQQKIHNYVQPFAQADADHARFIADGQVQQEHSFMLANWQNWWQPLQEHTDEILRKISEDLMAIEEKSKRGFSLFGLWGG